MILQFTADREKAARAGAPAKKFINATGAYTGVIRRAYIRQTKGGAQMFYIDFEADDGEKVSTNVCIAKKDGSPCFGEDIVHALMVVLNVGSMQAVKKTITEANGDKASVPFFNEVVGKPVGLFLQRENYVGNDGKEHYRINLLTPFNAKTQQNAKEIIEGAVANRIAEMTASVKDKVAKQTAPAQAAPAESFETVAVQQVPDDDIPF
jgi:hypothetical protein